MSSMSATILTARSHSIWHIIGLPLLLRKYNAVFSFFLRQYSHYDILGVSRTASKNEIRHAFLKLSKQCHPDRNRQVGEKSNKEHHTKFVKINEAYSVLSKPMSRRDYDLTLDTEHSVDNHMKSSGYHYPNEPYRYPKTRHTYYQNRYNETYWGENKEDNNESNEKFNPMTDIFFAPFFVTAVLVAGIFYYMNSFIPDPKLKKLQKNLSPEEIEKYDLIMTSNHEGTTVYYYAIPKENGSNDFEILALKREKTDDSKIEVLSELTDVYRERKEK